ncbi:MAG: cation transporter, partial [Chloroflexi bacterium]|nr:cation transporter [Chloroflexota bacterium]
MPSLGNPGSQGGHSHAEAHSAVALTSRRIAAVSLFVTVCLLALKLTVGIISDSIAVLSDAVDSGTDLAGGAAAFVSLRIAAQPADEGHPYGHGKVEAVSASVAATVVGLGG